MSRNSAEPPPTDDWHADPSAFVQHCEDELLDLSDSDVLRAWLDAKGLGSLLRMPMHAIAAMVGEHTWSVQPLYAAFGHAFKRREAAHLLAKVVLARRRAEAYHAQAEAWWSEPPAEPVLRSAWELLRQRGAHVPGVVPTAEQRNVQLVRDPPGLQHRASHAQLIFEPAGLLHPSPTALVAFLDALTVPESVWPAGAAVRSELVEILGVPRTMRDLAVLLQALEPPAPADTDASRWLGWEVDVSTHVEVRPVRCRPKKTGSGFVLKRTRGPSDLPPERVPADELALAHITTASRLDALVGHPRVFFRVDGRCDGMPRRVRRGVLALALRGPDDGGEDPNGSEGVDVGIDLDGRPIEPIALQRPHRIDNAWVLKGSDTELVLAPLRDRIARVADLLLQRGALRVPSGAHLLGALPRLTESTEVRADPRTLGAPVESDPRPVVRMAFDADGLHIDVRVQPLPESPSTEPGRGSALVVGERDGAIVHVHRDLDAEPAWVEAAIAPLLLPASSRDGFTWRIPHTQAALDVVARARAHHERFQVVWGGERVSLATREGIAKDLRLTIRRKRRWFGVDGDLEFDGQSVGLAVLLRAAREGHAWVPLSTGQWLRLSDSLRNQLAAAAAAAHDQASGASLGAVHAPVLEPLVEHGATLDAPPDWLEMAERCRAAAAMEPELPTTLQATLRPYQREGFAWMARLAAWAPGACLADDMGLGKTIQAIALLLARREAPALVVAPTSLLTNWHRELARFAPSLSVSVFHGTTRELRVAPGMVTLTTYGVMLTEQSALQAHHFGTVILDEAQAIKNPQSLRSQAARELNADFRLALSGTPVENRIAELWSLFLFVSPGLLGDASHFRDRFVKPIEGHNDADRKRALAKLVGPFILRRTKREVATDLPPRTEIVHRVELSGAERTLYERARYAAQKRIKGTLEPKARFVIFQELLRLRKLACHPRLEDDGSTVSSSKLAALRRIVSDLRDAGHRALIFSTFTSHLALVREALTEDGLSLRYLDGQMSPAQRLREVDAFQAGEGDAFLISTMAGGVGLNLTAATYVLHIDPWWNPAVEDQATDRAHRIGQDQPVTVIRLVAAHTIEEQIVELHASKRALADALLSESGSTEHVGVDELMALLEAADAPVMAAPVHETDAMVVLEPELSPTAAAGGHPATT